MSSNISTSIIIGEASETDSDNDESNTCTVPNASSATKMPTSVQGEIITGEDSESDIDLNASVVSIELGQENKSLETVSTTFVASPSPERVEKKFNSLLHKKLRENNTTAYRNLNTFFSTKVSESTTSLNGTDRQLMKSQLTLQATLNSLRNLNANSMSIKNKLHAVIDANFLQNLVLTKKLC